jgi:mono/diheme cytochrome c family protein
MQKTKNPIRWLRFAALMLAAAALLTACALAASEPAGPEPAAAVADIRIPGVPAQAVPLFVENCSACHGSQGQGSEIAPPLNSEALRARLDDGEIYETISNGRPGTAMPVWGERLDETQIQALVALIRNWDRMDAAQLAEMDSGAADCGPGIGMHPGMGMHHGMGRSCGAGMGGAGWWPFRR